MAQHLKEKHGQEGHIDGHGHEEKVFSVRKKFHQCQICKQPVVHSKTKLQEHFTQGGCESNISLSEYYETYIKGKLSSNSSSLNDTMRISSQTAFNSWAYQCRWRCIKCPVVKKSAVGIRAHLKLAHHHDMTPGDVGLKGKLMLSEFKHNCKLCSVGIIHDELFLSHHLRKKHQGMNLRQYYDQLIVLGTEISQKDIWITWFFFCRKKYNMVSKTQANIKQ